MAKIENMGTKSLVKNTIRRIRTNEVTDELDGIGMPGEAINRRGEDDIENQPPIPDEMFDQVIRGKYTIQFIYF